MKIGIEFITSSKIIDGIAAYTGGANYAKMAVKQLKENRKYDWINIILFLPEKIHLNDEDKKLFDDGNGGIRYTDSLARCDYSDLDIMFFPQVNGSTLHIISKIKKKFPKIKICATLHDRQHNFLRYDWKDRYYYRGIKRAGYLEFVEYYIKKMMFAYEYGRNLKYIDKIFTVSNYSMQRLSHKKAKDIKYYIQGNITENYTAVSAKKGNYILLVSGGRPEKNLLRTLEAYCKFKKQTRSNTRFKVTGISETTKQNLLRGLSAESSLIEDSVEFLPYVTYQQLSELYANCRYVVFMSKGEGYGLPVREAMSYGKTVLASRVTSVPEVAGAAIIYVDPFSIDSICNGFIKLNNDATLLRYESYISERNEIVKKLSKQDMEILIDDLLE